MDKQITYNLSAISGFKNLIKTGEITPDVEKYYTLNHYSTKANEKYRIITYNKEFLRPDLINSYGLLRSVILSGPKVVSFAPPKSLSGEHFMLKYPTKTKSIVAESFIEGTMINVFYDITHYETNDCWRIATRNTVGGDVSFYKGSNMTFNQMFSEACISNNIDIKLTRLLNPNFCYSFVLQHPANRIVVPFKKPQLYLVAVYEIIQTGRNLEKLINNSECKSLEDLVIKFASGNTPFGVMGTDVTIVEQNLSDVISRGLWNSTGVKFPEKYEFNTYTELIDKFASGNTPYDVMGIIVRNTETGERTKFRNPIYEEVRHLRGNQPKLQYQYLSLRHSGKLPEFLKYYPETKAEMSKFREQVHMFTENLHKNYISCYVKKEKALREYSCQYRTHMFKLHEHFTTNLRQNGLYVTNTEVIKYVNGLHPSLLMYCLNFNMRKRNVDTIKIESQQL